MLMILLSYSQLEGFLLFLNDYIIILILFLVTGDSPAPANRLDKVRKEKEGKPSAIDNSRRRISNSANPQQYQPSAPSVGANQGAAGKRIGGAGGLRPSKSSKGKNNGEKLKFSEVARAQYAGEVELIEGD